MEMDDFDFKPITTGLGFDKKAEEVKNIRVNTTAARKSGAYRTEDLLSKPDAVPSVSAKRDTVKPDIFEKPVDWDTKAPSKTSHSIAELMSALPPSMDIFDEKKVPPKNSGKEVVKVYRPIGRSEYESPLNKDLSAEKEISAILDERVDVSLNNTLEKAFPQVGFRRPFFHQSVEVREQYVSVSSSFTSALLDGLVILGLTALFMVGLVVLTGIDLIAVVLHPGTPLQTSMEVATITFGIYLLYYMAARGIWGSTLGDWAFDIQLGMEPDRGHWYYPFQVIARMILIAATGFVIVPLVSFIAKRDVAYYFSGLKLYMRTY